MYNLLYAQLYTYIFRYFMNFIYREINFFILMIPARLILMIEIKCFKMKIINYINRKIPILIL